MGRARVKHKKTVRVASASATTTPSPSISSLLSKAQDLIVQCDYSLARKFTERVLAREDATPAEKNQVKEMLAVTLLETGDIDAAKQVCHRFMPPAQSTEIFARSSSPSFPLIRRPRRLHLRLHVCTLHSSQTTTRVLLSLTTNPRSISCRPSSKENPPRPETHPKTTIPKPRETSSALISA